MKKKFKVLMFLISITLLFGVCKSNVKAAPSNVGLEIIESEKTDEDAWVPYALGTFIGLMTGAVIVFGIHLYNEKQAEKGKVMAKSIKRKHSISYVNAHKKEVKKNNQAVIKNVEKSNLNDFKNKYGL